jgi:hypothetical protein
MAKEGKKDKAGVKPPERFFSEMPLRPKPASHVEVNFGFRGDWLRGNIPRGSTEEDVNEFASQFHRIQLAMPDYSGIPFQDQDFRCYRYLSNGVKIWITLKTAQPKHTAIIRVSPEPTQEEIEEAV